MLTDVTMVMTVSSNVTSEAAGGISVNVSVDAGDLTGNLSLGLSTVPLSANSMFTNTLISNHTTSLV